MVGLHLSELPVYVRVEFLAGICDRQHFLFYLGVVAFCTRHGA